MASPDTRGDADLAHRLDRVEQVHAGVICITDGVGAKTLPAPAKKRNRGTGILWKIHKEHTDKTYGMDYDGRKNYVNKQLGMATAANSSGQRSRVYKCKESWCKMLFKVERVSNEISTNQILCTCSDEFFFEESDIMFVEHSDLPVVSSTRKSHKTSRPNTKLGWVVSSSKIIGTSSSGRNIRQSIHGRGEYLPRRRSSSSSSSSSRRSGCENSVTFPVHDLLEFKESDMPQSALPCIYCEKMTIETHPYVTKRGKSVAFCQVCRDVWIKYRNQLGEEKKLIHNGETNEECCAVCAYQPKELVLCEHCVRSYCRCCAVKLQTPKEVVDMDISDIWQCFACTGVDHTADVEIIEEVVDSLSSLEEAADTLLSL